MNIIKKPGDWLVKLATKYRNEQILQANHYEKRLKRKLERLFGSVDYQRIIYYWDNESGRPNFYIADFVIEPLDIIVEADGVQHLSKDGRKSDAKRTKVLEKLGYVVVRFNNSEIFTLKDEYVLKLIEEAYERKEHLVKVMQLRKEYAASKTKGI